MILNLNQPIPNRSPVKLLLIRQLPILRNLNQDTVNFNTKENINKDNFIA